MPASLHSPPPPPFDDAPPLRTAPVWHRQAVVVGRFFAIQGLLAQQSPASFHQSSLHFLLHAALQHPFRLLPVPRPVSFALALASLLQFAPCIQLVLL